MSGELKYLGPDEQVTVLEALAAGADMKTLTCIHTVRAMATDVATGETDIAKLETITVIFGSLMNDEMRASVLENTLRIASNFPELDPEKMIAKVREDLGNIDVSKLKEKLTTIKLWP